ncbi:SAM-dependent methyltransferase [Streptomyces mangrovi]|uniref:SAM-dependent methyltransferase n=1 Tax=Streptomyces mangrovi TaxID=1206892 RepID=UPI00399C5402
MTDFAGTDADTDADQRGTAESPTARSASSARVYNAMGGGKDHYLPDEEIARKIVELWPTVGRAVQANRAFIHASARWLAQEVGIRQFLDLGCGIPAPNSPNLHETAQQIAPASRALYVDNDPTVLAHTSALLVSAPEGRTAYLNADATAPDSVLTSRELTDTLDLGRPVGLFLCALLHLIPDHQDPRGIVGRFTEALAPGSHVVISHATPDHDPALMEQVAEVYARSGRVNATGTLRRREEIEHLLGDRLELVEPGIVPAHRWQPGTAAGDADLPDDAINCYALVARKP